MAYCDLDDIKDMMDEDEIIRYTDDFDQGIVITSVTDKAIAGADALIDAYLGSKYTVPITPVPDIIADLAVDIAIFKICSRRSQAPEGIRQKYDDAVKFLEKVAAGKAVIQGALSAPSETSAGTVTITSNTRIFSRDKLEGF